MVKKKKKYKEKKPLFTFGFAKSTGRHKVNLHRLDWAAILKIAAVLCVIGGMAVGVVFLERYVTSKVGKARALELVDVPAWANNALKEKIQQAAGYNGEDFTLDEDVAKTVRENISTRLAWLDDVTVQAYGDKLLIRAKWRKPVGLIELDKSQKFYVDKDMIVLDYLAMPAIVEIKGLPADKNKPIKGRVWQRDDLAAAIKILTLLEKRDSDNNGVKPLLAEIASIDVSNFDGRNGEKRPHILLHAVDGTEIIWGAEIGAWQRHMEVSDEEKLAGLYGYYQENGTLLNGGAKYINLCDPK